MLQPRLLLAGAHSAVGKTSLSAGIMSALTRRGLNVQPWKVGPDYIDPAFHSFVTGYKSRNLDAWMLGEEKVQELFRRTAPQAGEGLSIVEGVMGLFDGHIGDNSGSSAHLAQILAAPTLLIISGASIARSAAALVRGYHHFLPDFRLSGVIINRVSSEAHYQLLKKFVEEEAGVPCFGYLRHNPSFSLESRHLGLVPSVEVEGLAQTLAALAEEVEKSIDLDGLLALAHQAPELPPPPPCPQPPLKRARLGVARDKAFNFYYQDSLELLEYCGAELVYFSPLSDEKLPPQLAGLYIGGGFPEVFGAELEANRSLRSEIKAFLEAGAPAYAECGGLLYLGRRLSDTEGRSFEMVGFFPYETVMGKRLQNFGYVEAIFDRDTVLGPAGLKVRAHEFHHSKILPPEPDYALTIHKSARRSWRGGICRLNTLAAYPHLHFQAQPALAVNFVTKCQLFSEAKGSGS